MNQISSRDLGFVVAKILALIAWRSAASMLFIAVAMGISSAQFFRSDPEMAKVQIATVISTCAFAGATVYVGLRLWLNADRFGAAPGDEEQIENVSISRSLLMQGLAIGAAILLLVPTIPVIGGAIWRIIGSDPAGGAKPYTTRELFVDGLSAALAIVLLVWAYQSGKQTGQVQPEESA